MRPENHNRIHIEITGRVQGVGFRPYCYVLAQRFNLSGWVLNHGSGVCLEVQGEKVKNFIKVLGEELPPLARIDRIQQQKIPLEDDEQGFVIRESRYNKITTTIPPDSGVCMACLQELFNPTSRYYRYPFINCTHCGPRYTVTQRLPYDRHNTAMATFDLCSPCQREYNDPGNRRYHAQATACTACGPRLSMSIDEIIQRLRQGQILAIKGLGGFHLVCDAKNHDAVQSLRKRKNRAAKPFAIMAANLQSLEKLVHLTEPERELLESPQRPIVLATKKPGTDLSPALAPELNCLGVMLPYTPLHFLIFNAAAGNPDSTDWQQHSIDFTLVMTSANRGGEPLVIDNQEAIQRLDNIADNIVDYNRDIICRSDDSVMRISNGKPRFIRRARSFIPQAIKLPHAVPSVLAVGGHLKNIICITRGDEAFLSQHIGDLDNRATYVFFEETVQHLLNTLAITPECIAHDKHPDFYSSRFAQSYGLSTIAIQHHHAHLAAVAAEHGVTQPAIGLALDGFGLGENNQNWGGELLLLDGAHYQRLGHLSPLKQSGADRAAREPWRMAAGVLHQLGRSSEIASYFKQQEAKLLQQMLEKNINCPETSSAGRLFDAAAGLLKIQLVNDYEAHAAMKLENLVTQPEIMRNGWQVADNQLSFFSALEKLIDCDPVHGANLFHGTLIAGLSQWLEQNANQHNIKTILLGGGCFLNQVLSTGLINDLTAKGFDVKLAEQAPINDGGLSLGQAWVAGLING